MSYWNYGYGYYTPTKPKDVKDGIKLQSGKIGSTWWSKKWILLLNHSATPLVCKGAGDTPAGVR